jgi:CubicO group peptidase (beta-lactamase class C family)
VLVPGSGRRTCTTSPLTISVESNEEFLRRLLGGDFLLWSPNIQAEAFLNWEKIWATRAIRKGVPRPLRHATKQLNITFESRGVTRTVDDLIRCEFISGLLVLRDGEVRLERYAKGLAPELCWQSSSMVKSLAAILVGAAIKDGAIESIDQPIADYLPELLGSCYQGVTIRHLLQMSSGISWTENTDDIATDVTEHYIKAIAGRKPGYIIDCLMTKPRAHAPGSRFNYNTADVFLLSPMLSRATGMTVADYCSQKLWQPLGCEQDGYFMLEADDGQEVLGSCSGASLRDYARWGQFMLADGVIDGQRIVPEGWVAQCISPTAPCFAHQVDPAHPFKGYGFLWWVRENGDYAARGSFGQWMYVNPTHKIVVVMLAAIPRYVYMDAAERKLHNMSHMGSAMRIDFIDTVIAEA